MQRSWFSFGVSTLFPIAAALGGLAACQVPNPSPEQTLAADGTAAPVVSQRDDVAGITYWNAQGSAKGLIVYVHGGAWVFGSRELLSKAAQRLVSRGWTVASVDYALAARPSPGVVTNPFPAALRDVKQAIVTAKQREASRRMIFVDSLRTVLMGDSAGGHLAALAGVTWGTVSPGTSAAERAWLRPAGWPPVCEPGQTVSCMPANADRADAVVSLAGPLDLKEIIDVGFSRLGNLVVAKNLATFLNCRAATACDCFDDPTCGIHDACPVPGPSDFVPPAFASVARHLDASDPPIYAAFAAKDALIAPTTACSAGQEYLGQERPLHFAVDITECSDGGGTCTTPECDQLPCHSHAVLGMNVAVFDTWLSFIESGTLPSTSDDVVLEPATCMRDATWPAWSASTTEAIFCASGGCDPCLPF